MTPQTGQHVKCILRNGAVAEGIVIEWFASEVQLRSLDHESILIITHPTEDIILIKVITGMPKIDLPLIDEVIDTTEVITAPLAYDALATKSDLEDKFEEAKTLPMDDPERIKALAKLRIMMAEQDKKIISEKVRNHFPSETRKIQYGYPGLIKKPSPK
jgi:hypothetical protein